MPVELECPSCNTHFKVKPSHADRRKYCSKDCMGKGFQNKVKRECEWCGKSFKVVKSRVEHGRGKHCSKGCQYEANSEKLRSDEREEFECLNCEEAFTLLVSTIKSREGAGKYCSRECRDSHWRGQNHPQFIHGSNANVYGSNWQSQRRAARERDNHTCQRCGESDSVLDVHHKLPRRYFEVVEQSNVLENLITLCRSCHRTVEAKIHALEKDKGNDE